jgi:hypothetical protein
MEGFAAAMGSCPCEHGGLTAAGPCAMLLQVGMYYDKVGPTVIASLVLVTLAIVFGIALYDFLY